jgi:hypothetical protein
VNRDQGKVTKDQSEFTWVQGFDLLPGLIEVRTVGALEVAIYHERNWSIGIAVGMIILTDWSNG